MNAGSDWMRPARSRVSSGPIGSSGGSRNRSWSSSFCWRKVDLPLKPRMAKMKEKFGDAVFLPDGSLNRARLSKIVFEDKNELKWLEGFLHPRIRESWESTVSEWQNLELSIGVVVIPLLFETGIQDRFDSVICMACSSSTQRARLQLRGWDSTHIDQRLSAQWSLGEKMTASNFVIWSDTTASGSFLQWDLVLKRIRAEKEKS